MKPIKCEKCTGNADRLTVPPDIKHQPEKCQVCSNNPLLIDNFEAMPIHWPPKEDQDVWCISVRGDIYETCYDSERNWSNLVNVYPTEESAKKAIDTLLKARGLENE